MSRLDWFTITVVGICIAAIVFLLFRTSSLLNNEDSIMKDPNNTEVTGDTDSDLSSDDVYTDETIDPDNYDADSDDEANDSDGESDGTFDSDGTDDSDSGVAGSNSGKIDDDTSSDVTDESADEEPRINTSPTSGNSSGNYLVVAGSFSQMINAENFVKTLKNKGYNGAEIGRFNAGKYATALAGRFDSQSEAKALVDDLKANGIEAYIQKRK